METMPERGLNAWLDELYSDENYTHLIVACDSFDHEDYPVFVSKYHSIHEEVRKRQDIKNMSEVHAVYNAKVPRSMQKPRGRVWDIDVPEEAQPDFVKKELEAARDSDLYRSVLQEQGQLAIQAMALWTVEDAKMLATAFAGDLGPCAYAVMHKLNGPDRFVFTLNVVEGLPTKRRSTPDG